MYEQGNHHKIRFMAGVCSQVLERFQGNWLWLLPMITASREELITQLRLRYFLRYG
jgi:hypothetical protein